MSGGDPVMRGGRATNFRVSGIYSPRFKKKKSLVRGIWATVSLVCEILGRPN